MLKAPAATTVKHVRGPSMLFHNCLLTALQVSSDKPPGKNMCYTITYKPHTHHITKQSPQVALLSGLPESPSHRPRDPSRDSPRSIPRRTRKERTTHKKTTHASQVSPTHLPKALKFFLFPSSLELQPYPQKVVRPPKPTPTTF